MLSGAPDTSQLPSQIPQMLSQGETAFSLGWVRGRVCLSDKGGEKDHLGASHPFPEAKSNSSRPRKSDFGGVFRAGL